MALPPLIDADTVHALLPMADCIDVMAATQRAITAGEIRIPLRSSVALEDDNSLLLMPGAAGNVFGAKLLSLYPGNLELPTIQGFIMLFDAADGRPLALLDAASITARRTAAASAAATRVLAREDARSLALLGYGVQAISHLEAMLCIRPIEQLFVWGPRGDRARGFAEKAAARYGIDAEVLDDPAEAAARADIVCAVSRATSPIIEGTRLRPGCHLNVVGAHTASTREVDSETVARARVYTEITEFALAEAGDLLLAFDELGLTADAIVGELGAVIAGDCPGRGNDEEITLYKNLGNVAQDLAAAAHVLERLRASSIEETEP